MLTLEARLKQRSARMKRHKLNDFQLSDEPLSDPFVLTTGHTDRYLEKLREVYGIDGVRKGKDS